MQKREGQILDLDNSPVPSKIPKSGSDVCYFSVIINFVVVIDCYCVVVLIIAILFVIVIIVCSCLFHCCDFHIIIIPCRYHWAKVFATYQLLGAVVAGSACPHDDACGKPRGSGIPHKRF